ncbi:hypothetical protein GP486_005711 [Trichoglossum hirsutum]|uniref:Uncharacterized protein n=1 Tax=Trichoglossum hirsutum TaxID=265104 RepID=A0A9P8L8P5_9PEZI|nr:hypothetical protein GP486_005711 [Trichoglossum hirsutum]
MSSSQPIRIGTTRQVSSSRTSTPPDQIISLPPSQPQSRSAEKPPARNSSTSLAAVQTALHLLQEHRKGRLDKLWYTVHLSPEDYGELRKELRNQSLYGYVEDKVRCDYDPKASRFIIRMTTPTHDDFIDSIAIEIQSQLERIGHGAEQPVIDAIKGIKRQSWRIKLRDDVWDRNSKYPQHCPDMAFRHKASIYPAVIIEVSYSQKRKDLGYLANNYIIGSGGSIRAVVGLDIEYGGGTKKATVSVWRPRIRTNDDGKLLFGVAQVINSRVRESAVDTLKER